MLILAATCTQMQHQHTDANHIFVSTKMGTIQIRTLFNNFVGQIVDLITCVLTRAAAAAK